MAHNLHLRPLITNPNVPNTIIAIRLKKGQIKWTSSKWRSNDPTIAGVVVALVLTLALYVVVVGARHHYASMLTQSFCDVSL